MNWTYLISILSVLGSILSAIVVATYQIGKFKTLVEQQLLNFNKDKNRMEIQIDTLKKDFNDYCKDTNDSVNAILTSQKLLEQGFKLFSEDVRKNIESLLKWKDSRG